MYFPKICLKSDQKKKKKKEKKRKRNDGVLDGRTELWDYFYSILWRTIVDVCQGATNVTSDKAMTDSSFNMLQFLINESMEEPWANRYNLPISW